MKQLANLQEITRAAREASAKSRSVGLVPTMGALHDGHRTLIERSAKENDITMVSVFVNPLQFNDPGDLKSYPRTLEEDAALCASAGADILFTLSADEMYPAGFQSLVRVKELSLEFEGKERPGHFDGVTTVVLKLFNIARPTRAYFGEKDFQQLAVVRRMVKDLNLPVEVVACPTIREKDGLAMSSRNRHLPTTERNQALALIHSIRAVQVAFSEGTQSTSELEMKGKEEFAKFEKMTLEYLRVVDAETLLASDHANENSRILVAGRLGHVRLIDNDFIALANAAEP